MNLTLKDNEAEGGGFNLLSITFSWEAKRQKTEEQP